MGIYFYVYFLCVWRSSVCGVVWLSRASSKGFIKFFFNSLKKRRKRGISSRHLVTIVHGARKARLSRAVLHNTRGLIPLHCSLGFFVQVVVHLLAG